MARVVGRAGCPIALRPPAWLRGGGPGSSNAWQPLPSNRKPVILRSGASCAATRSHAAGNERRFFSCSQAQLQRAWSPFTKSASWGNFLAASEASRHSRNFHNRAAAAGLATMTAPAPARTSEGLPLEHSSIVAGLPWRSLELIYCVNLDRRPERWSFMQDQFATLRMPVQRWSAVDGLKLDVPHLAEVGIIAKEALPRFFLPDEEKLFGTDLTNGGIGCALSHMMIWRDIIHRVSEGTATPESVFMVVEDDCEFVEGFSEELLNERISHVPADWELIYLGGQDLLRRQHQYEVGQGVRRLYKGFRETTAYLINDTGAKVCLEVCVPMHWQVDTHLNDESLRNGLQPRRPDEADCTMRPRGYCLFPPIVSQQERRFPTDVQKVEHD